MTVKEHYDKHLGRVYSWMLGDFQERMSEQKEFFLSRRVVPAGNRLAFDLGAGHGIQSLALANLGFNVRAVDFNKQLLKELVANRGTLPVDAVESDILSFLNEATEGPEVIICMGDTLTHFTGYDEVIKVVRRISNLLPKKGKFVVSWRDLSEERKGTDRFLHVRSDDHRILNCFLEYFPIYVMVHDILLEKFSGNWAQTTSAYAKLRISLSVFRQTLMDHSIAIVHADMIRGMTYVVAEKV